MRFLIVFLGVVFSCSGWSADRPQTGDLIFQTSQSSQANAIKEATGSKWTHMGVVVVDGGEVLVYEAIQPVKVTPFRDFVRRGKDNYFEVKRLRSKELDMSKPRNQSQLVEALESRLGQNYDIYFEWSEDRIYCSEYAFKSYFDAFQVEVGEVQRYRDLRLDGPYMKKLIYERITKTGRKLNLDELIVSPVSVFESENLISVNYQQIL